VHHTNGEPDGARRLVGNTMQQLDRLGARQVILWCPSCNEHYDDVVSRDQPVPFPYEHMTAFVARHLDRVRFVRRVERTVAVHYHTGHPQQDTDRACARTILESIPGLTYVEIANPPELGRHCSAKYIGRVGRPAWQEHVTAILDAAAAAGADTLATLYHSCQREICAEEAGRPFEIVNWVSLLGEAMGIEYPDDYKRWKLTGDPEAILEEVSPCAEANQLDPERVRQVVTTTFAAPPERRLPNPS
jgi:Fe-S oxidoreductase